MKEPSADYSTGGDATVVVRIHHQAISMGLNIPQKLIHAKKIPNNVTCPQNYLFNHEPPGKRNFVHEGQPLI